MININKYITEKLKIDKDVTPNEFKGKYGLHDNKVVDKILYMTDISNVIITTGLEDWVKENKVLDVEGYIDYKSMKTLKLDESKEHLFNLMNREPIRDYIIKNCKLQYSNNQIEYFSDSKSICFVFSKSKTDIAYMAFRKY